MTNTKRILVAGGSGFLGINLCKDLLAEGHEVICLDNFSSGSRANLTHLFEYQTQHGRLSVLERDVSEPVIESVIDGDMDEIYNLGQRACYDEGKRCAETLCMDYHRTHGVDVKIARRFNIYGPYMQPHDGRVVSNFIVQALLNRPITIYGDGSQTRSFCYVDDLIVGIKAMIRSARSVTGPVNLGNPEEFTVLELAQKVIDLTSSSSNIVFKPLPKDDPVRRRPDIGRARRLLKWKPCVALEPGLIRTINYFERPLQARRSSETFAGRQDLRAVDF
jgi:UDP-glucuronate decarboxylase